MTVLQKNNINFALYNCNWTEMDITFKKLLLLSMQINNSENLKLKATAQIIINLQLFSNVNIHIIIFIFDLTNTILYYTSFPNQRYSGKDLVLNVCNVMSKKTRTEW